VCGDGETSVADMSVHRHLNPGGLGADGRGVPGGSCELQQQILLSQQSINSWRGSDTDTASTLPHRCRAASSSRCNAACAARALASSARHFRLGRL